MPLQSQLFRGDPKLEACLVQDSAHVTQGAIGEYVAKIQFALNVLDDLSIVDSEVSTQTSGSSTAAAVLAFKKKRNVINKSYQTQADKIVGKMTIATVDKEMFEHEREPTPCDVCLMNTRGGDIEPGGPPDLRSGGRASLNFAIATQPVAQTVLTPRDAALQAVPLPQLWTSFGAISELDTLLALKFVDGLQKNSKLALAPVFDIVNTHFHRNRDPQRLRQNLQRLHQVFGLIQTVLAQTSNSSRAGRSRPSHLSPPAAFNSPNTQFNHITFRPGFLTCGPNTRAAMVVHECAHFVGGLNVITHFSMEFPAPQGAPQGKGHVRNYQDLLVSFGAANITL